MTTTQEVRERGDFGNSLQEMAQDFSQRIDRFAPYAEIKSFRVQFGAAGISVEVVSRKRAFIRTRPTSEEYTEMHAEQIKG